MGCERLTIACEVPPPNMLLMVAEQIQEFGNEHGHIRGLVGKEGAKALKAELADATGKMHLVSPDALFEIAGAEFFSDDTVAETLESGAQIVCELECVTHEKTLPEGSELPPVKKRRGRPPKQKGGDAHERPAGPQQDTASAVVATAAAADMTFGALVQVASETGLRLAPDLSWEQYEGLAKSVGRASKGLQWWAGDMADYGEKKFGELYAQVLDDLGMTMESLSNAKWVCGRFPIERRRKELSFGHHKAVASMEPSKADAWLERAARGESGKIWSVSRLDENIRNARQETKTETKPSRKTGDKRAAAPEPPPKQEETEVAGKRLSLKKDKPQAAEPAQAVAAANKWLVDYETRINGIEDPAGIFKELGDQVSASTEGLMMLSAALQTVQGDIAQEDLGEENLKMLLKALADASPQLVLLQRITDRTMRFMAD